MRKQKSCARCLAPTRNRSYCDACTAIVGRERHNRAYDRGAYRSARNAAIARHRARYGDWCPGRPGHPAHPSRDLTANHPVALANGGALVQEFEIICGALNSSIGARE